MHIEIEEASVRDRGLNGLNARYQIIEGRLSDPKLKSEGATTPSAGLMNAFLAAVNKDIANAEGGKVKFHIDHHMKGGDRHMLTMQFKGLDIVFCENIAKGQIYQLNKRRPKPLGWS